MSPLRNTRGATLPLALLLLVVLTVGLVTGMNVVSGERKIDADRRAQTGALTIAESGLEQYFGRTITAPAAATRDSIPTPGGYAIVTATQLYDQDGARTFVIRSTGVNTAARRYDAQTPPARRTVAQYALWAAPFSTFAAVTALAGVTLGSSRDQISGAGGAGLTSAGYPRRAPAVSVPDGLVSGDPTIPRGGPGNPDIQYLGSGSDALAAVNVDWNAIVNGGALVPDAEFAANSDGGADPAYRLPTGGGFPVIYAHGNYTFDQGSSVVTGLLIVENDLILDKQIEFQGVMLVGGTIIDTAHAGDAQVHGSVITGLNLKLPDGALPGYPPPAPLMLGNTGTTGRQFMWDANAVQQAMARFGPPLVRRIRSTRSDNLPGS